MEEKGYSDPLISQEQRLPHQYTKHKRRFRRNKQIDEMVAPIHNRLSYTQTVPKRIYCILLHTSYLENSPSEHPLLPRPLRPSI